MRRSGFKNRGKPLQRKTPIARGKPTLARKPLIRKRMHSTSPPTAEHKARWAKMRHIGCIACYLNSDKGLEPVPQFTVEMHHLLSGGRRISHEATICLCPHHHQSVPTKDTPSKRAMVERYGPTVAEQGKAFTLTYGDGAYLLTLQNTLIQELKRV